MDSLTAKVCWAIPDLPAMYVLIIDSLHHFSPSHTGPEVCHVLTFKEKENKHFPLHFYLESCVSPPPPHTHTLYSVQSRKVLSVGEEVGDTGACSHCFLPPGLWALNGHCCHLGKSQSFSHLCLAGTFDFMASCLIKNPYGQ